MHKISFIKRLIPILFILLIIVCGVFVANLLFTKGDSTNTAYIPQSASLVIRIDGKSIFKEGASALLYKNDDKELTSLIYSLIQDNDDQPYKDNGINILSDIILFKDQCKQQEVSVILVNLTNAESFKIQFEKSPEPQRAIYSNSDIGVIASVSPSALLSQGDLQKYCRDILSSKKASILNNHRPLIQLKTNNNNPHSPIISSDLKLDTKENTILFDGQIITNKTAHFQSFSLIPEGFHFSSQIIPKAINDSLLRIFGGAFPKIKGISVNHFGTEIVEGNKTSVIPKIDACIEFESSINSTLLFEALQQRGIIDSIMEDEVFINKQLFYHHKLNDETIYFGVHKYSAEKISSSTKLFDISGDPHLLTKVEGGGLISRLLTIIPAYNASNQLMNNIRSLEITARKINGEKHSVKGSVEFKDDHFPPLELIRFVLYGQFIQ